MDVVADYKEGNRAMWAAGDYAAVQEKISEVGERIIGRVAVRPGEEVLDVACGAGNAAIPAAAIGARVIGVDLTPELFEPGRKLAEAAGVEIEWIEGDAEALPVDDESIDVVVSTFGCMFAPRHEVTARELARVLRPGGRLGLCNWTPEGSVGEFFRTVATHVPPLPDFASPPPLWGSEEHVRALFDGTGIELEFDREVVDLKIDSVAAGTEFYEGKFGPVVKARELLEPQGRWTALHNDLTAFFERQLASRDGGSMAWPAQYLVVLGSKPR